MILLVDVGNSRTKWAIADARTGKILVSGALASGDEHQLGEHVEQNAASLPLARVAVSCVGSQSRLDTISGIVSERFRISPVILSTATEIAGLRNGYIEPGRLGVDRWLAMVGAWTQRKNPCLVVDAGTALTVDAIGAHGMHLGGYIVPGIMLQETALRQGTTSVRPGIANPRKGFGVCTADAVAVGVRTGLAALIDRAYVELQGSLDDTCLVFMTGGDAADVATHMQSKVIFDNHLVFRGMLVSLGTTAG